MGAQMANIQPMNFHNKFIDFIAFFRFLFTFPFPLNGYEYNKNVDLFSTGLNSAKVLTCKKLSDFLESISFKCRDIFAKYGAWHRYTVGNIGYPL